MKAFQVNAPHDYRVAEVEEPTAGAGEVLVRVAFAGICGSDMHIIHGDNAFVRFPRITGHEFAGVIDAVGEGVTDVAVGDHVCVDPVISCGTCYPCRINRTNVCSAAPKMGPSLSDALSSPILPDADDKKPGRGTFDTLTGNPLAR